MKMSDEITKYISDHRDEFDLQFPKPALWEKIEADIFPGKPAKVYVKLSLIYAAAAIFILLLASGIYLITKQRSGGEKVLSETGVQKDAAPADPEVTGFVRMISEKQQELRFIGKDEPELFGKFSADLKKIDSSFSSLNAQFSSGTNKEILLEAIIDNLETKLRLINRQLEILKQIKLSKKAAHEKGNSSI